MKISRCMGFFVLILSLSGTQAIGAFSLKRDRSEPSITVREVSVNSIVQAPRDTDVETEEKSSSYQLPEDLPNVLINQELIDAAKQRLSQSPETYPLTHKAYKNIQNTARTFYQQSSSQLPIYSGTNPDEYRPLVEKDLAKTLHLAVVCAIENKQNYCQRAADIILAWAKKESGTRLGNGNDSYLIGTGLDISRLFYSYAQAFSMVSSSLSNQEKKIVEDWFLDLGKQVQKSHKYWLKNLQIEGANNHLSWHSQGMLIAALYGGNRSLLSYMMDGNRWSYRNLVRDAIYEQNNPDNIFRADRDFAHLPIQVRTGEVYDRHRSLPHPPAREDIYNREKWWNQKVRQRAGFAYSMFHLEALVLTAHIAQLNDISYSGGKSFMNIYNKSIRNALRFYGEYYIDYPSGRSDCQSISNLELSPEPYSRKCPISYEPYFGEHPAYHKTHVFMIAQKYYPEDRSFYKKIILENQKALIPAQVPPPHGPINIFTFFFAEE
ncbi:MAG: alginate lyase family protein, partial [Cyanobacteriota bacterium]|nr:alginate lyase family protein [Cyanobacteriota bacterium]